MCQIVDWILEEVLTPNSQYSILDQERASYARSRRLMAEWTLGGIITDGIETCYLSSESVQPVSGSPRSCPIRRLIPEYLASQLSSIPFSGNQSHPQALVVS